MHILLLLDRLLSRANRGMPTTERDIWRYRDPLADNITDSFTTSSPLPGEEQGLSGWGNGCGIGGSVREGAHDAATAASDYEGECSGVGRGAWLGGGASVYHRLAESETSGAG